MATKRKYGYAVLDSSDFGEYRELGLPILMVYWLESKLEYEPFTGVSLARFPAPKNNVPMNDGSGGHISFEVISPRKVELWRDRQQAWEPLI